MAQGSRAQDWADTLFCSDQIQNRRSSYSLELNLTQVLCEREHKN